MSGRASGFVFIYAAIAAWGSPAAAGAERSDGWEKIPGASQSIVLREARFRLALESASPAQIRAALQELARGPRNAARAREYLTGLELLARHEGAGAPGFAQAHPFSPLAARELAEAVVRGWTARDPDAAERWLLSPAAGVSEDERPELIRVLLATEAQRDVAGALARARRLAGEGERAAGNLQNHALMIVEALVHAGKFTGAHAVARELEPAAVREAVQANLATISAAHQPALARNWYRELPPGTERSSALFRMLETFAAQDFTAAVEFYHSLDASEHSPDRVELLLVRARAAAPPEVQSLLETVADPPERERLAGLASRRTPAR